MWRGWCRRTCNLHHCFSVTYTFKGLRLQLINPFWEQLKNCNHLSKTLSRPKNVQFGVGAQLSFTHKFAIIKLCLKRHFMSFIFLQQQHWKLSVWLGCPNWVVSWLLTNPEYNVTKHLKMCSGAVEYNIHYKVVKFSLLILLLYIQHIRKNAR